MRYRCLVVVAVMGVLCLGSMAQADQPQGQIQIDISNVAGNALPSRIDLVPEDGGGSRRTFRVPEGRLQASCPPGRYTAYYYVYDWDLPIMVKVESVVVQPGETTFLLKVLLEGSGNRRLREFDRDGDLVLDRVELEMGTDPDDPADYPGAQPVPFKNTVISEESGWLKGDLHIRSEHSGGEESVAQIVRRAERAGLDFIAIADRNTLASLEDSGFQSDRVVLIPAMEWGDNDHGVALIYGPRTFPELTNNLLDGQGVVRRVQAQGGIFAIAHPLFPHAPWQRGLSYVNAIQVWCRGWRAVPPTPLEALNEQHQQRNSSGRLVHSMAQAAATDAFSANGQAALFWDYEITRGLRASPIAGSMASRRQTPLGEPLTYVQAPEKSVEGILEGLRRGRAYVSSGPSGPQLVFTADVLDSGIIDAEMGDIIPVGVPTKFYVLVRNARGKKVQVLKNGWPIITQRIDSQEFTIGFEREPISACAYRVRVIDEPSSEGFGDLDVLAMSAPIYAQNMMIVDQHTDPTDLWVHLRNENMEPLYVDSGAMDGDGRPLVYVDRQALPSYEGEFVPPPTDPVQTLDPRRF